MHTILFFFFRMYLHRLYISQNKSDYFPTQSYLCFVMESECVICEEVAEYISNLLCGCVM